MRSKRCVQPRCSCFAPGFLAAFLVACGPNESQQAANALTQAAQGSENIAASQFGRETVPCADNQAMARSLLELTSRDLPRDAEPRLLDSANEPVQLKDGPGKIVVIVFAISTGEDSAITTTEHFLVNRYCQVLHWKSVARSGD